MYALESQLQERTETVQPVQKVLFAIFVSIKKKIFLAGN